MTIRKSNQTAEDQQSVYERLPSPLDSAPQATVRIQPPEDGVWQQIRGELALQLVAGAFLDWVWPLTAVSLDDYVLRVACPDKRRLEIVTFRKPLFLRIMHSLKLDGLQLEFVLAPPRNNNRGH